ncbi:MAG: hypothetical protein JXQ99_09720 [Hyphomicrobiaceae bacterium]
MDKASRLWGSPSSARCRSANKLILSAAALLVVSLPVHAAEDPLAAQPTETSNIVTYALADTPASCSQRYHALLSSIVLPKARATQTVADAMRIEVDEMPGYWQFWDGNGITARTAHQNRLLAVQQIDRAENRMCVRSILARGGRIRCMKWKPIPAGYVPPPPVVPTVDPTKPEISPAERRIAARLATRVIGKGAFRELMHGRAFFHMAQRTTDELVAYASQPHRETMCTGAKELIGFYQRQLEPLSRKVTQAEQLQTETQVAAVATIRVALPDENTATPSGSPDFAALLGTLLLPVLNKDDHIIVTASGDPLRVLTQARDLLNDQRFEAMPKNRRGPLRKALRNIEFALYADYNLRRLRQLNRSYEATFKAIGDAHGRSCSCKPH